MVETGNTEPAVKLWSTYVKGQAAERDRSIRANDLMRDYWKPPTTDKPMHKRNAAGRVGKAKQLRKRDRNIADNYDKDDPSPPTADIPAIEMDLV